MAATYKSIDIMFLYSNDIITVKLLSDEAFSILHWINNSLSDWFL